jgi:hypothetical protein
LPPWLARRWVIVQSGRQDFGKGQVPYHEEYVEDSEGRRRHGEEVHRGYDFAMVPQECHPALAALCSP